MKKEYIIIYLFYYTKHYLQLIAYNWWWQPLKRYKERKNLEKHCKKLLNNFFKGIYNLNIICRVNKRHKLIPYNFGHKISKEFFACEDCGIGPDYLENLTNMYL